MIPLPPLLTSWNPLMKPHPSLPHSILDPHTPVQFLQALTDINTASSSFDSTVAPSIHSLDLLPLQMILAGLTIKMTQSDPVETFLAKIALRRLLPHMIARTKTLASIASLDSDDAPSPIDDD